jgi:hypothetical protein
MSRSTYRVTVEVTAEDAPEDYRNSTLADELQDIVFNDFPEATELNIVVIQVTGTDGAA